MPVNVIINARAHILTLTFTVRAVNEKLLGKTNFTRDGCALTRYKELFPQKKKIKKKRFETRDSSEIFGYVKVYYALGLEEKQGF